MKWIALITTFLFLFMMSCEHAKKVIVTGIDEREANIIVVFLESKGIPSEKEIFSGGTSSFGGGGGGTNNAGPKFNIVVQSYQSIQAMSLLNSHGLPKHPGITLLSLFEKQGIMSTPQENNIRFTEGLAQQIANTILKIDGILEVQVQLPFQDKQNLGEEEKEKKMSASVFVKHLGIFDEPNSHLESKIKLLVSAAVGLEFDQITVVADKARFANIVVDTTEEMMKKKAKEYVKIWSMTMESSSIKKFRTIFFCLLGFIIVLMTILSWIIWKVYPILRSQTNFKSFFHPSPFSSHAQEQQQE